jgi:hypothetical protein
MTLPTTPLADLLRRACAQLQSQAPPPDLQARVLDAARATLSQRAAEAAPARSPASKRPPRANRWRLSMWGTAGTLAAVVLGSVLLSSALPLLRPPELSAPGSAATSNAFVRLAPADRWPTDASAAWLVSTELPGERLAALGLPYDPARAGDRVRAELLVVPSGDVLAVRLMP